MTVRDTQRSTVYKAESVLKAHDRTTYETAAEVAQRVETILRSTWVRSRFLVHAYAVQIRTPEYRSRASYHGMATFTFPQWSWSDSIILHEVAHMLASRRAEDFGKLNPAYSWNVRIDHSPQSAHGWRFCQTLLELVGQFIGPLAAGDLRRSFATHLVRCSRP